MVYSVGTLCMVGWNGRNISQSFTGNSTEAKKKIDFPCFGHEFDGLQWASIEN